MDHECSGSMRGVYHSPPREVAMPISPILSINLFVFSLCRANHDSRFRAFSQHVQSRQEMPWQQSTWNINAYAPGKLYA